MQLTRRQLVLGAGALAATAAVSARIWWVNQTLPHIPLEYHDAGEWVALDGAFQSSAAEATDGYSLKVESAEVVTYDEYLTRYGDGTQELGRFGDARSVVDVGLRLRNDSGSEDGGINLFQAVLVPERANEYLICDVMNASALWPQVQKGASASVSIRPGTEYLAHVPYVWNGNEDVYEREVTDRRFSFLASRMPVRKMIWVTAPA